jgi:SHS family sialic acid transporter-like MFS transporter
MTAGFLVGAATGGVVFGWLGDRLGRVRAMALSILVYALFSGACGFATAPWQLFLFRFLASLGMGGEWSLGVSLVMEIWPNKSRGWLAGAIGAAANVGFVLVAVLGLVLTQVLGTVEGWLLGAGLSDETVARLVSNSGWRLLAMSAAAPALLTFIVRVFVPESEKWQEEHAKGATKQWSSFDLLAVFVGAAGALGLVSLWAFEESMRTQFVNLAGTIGLAEDRIAAIRESLTGRGMLAVQIVGTLLGLLIAYKGYTYPIRRYLQRSQASATMASHDWPPPRVLGRMLLGATLSGVALLGTWASIQQAPNWAGYLIEQEVAAAHPDASAEELKSLKKEPAVQTRAARARAFTVIASGLAAIVFTIVAALAGDWLGRRLSYFLLCILALGSSLLFFRGNSEFGNQFLATVFLAGGLTASFYGWLPLYLPELFPTRVRAFGQGFAFNFGRILAAIGALQFSYLMKNVFDGSYPQACTVLSCIYVVGMVVIWLAPETRGEPLPE